MKKLLIFSLAMLLFSGCETLNITPRSQSSGDWIVNVVGRQVTFRVNNPVNIDRVEYVFRNTTVVRTNKKDGFEYLAVLVPGTYEVTFKAYFKNELRIQEGRFYQITKQGSGFEAATL